MKKQPKKAVETAKPIYTKVCKDCGKRYRTMNLHRQFCPSCVKHRAVLATMRNRDKTKAALAEMKRVGTAADSFAEIHLKVRRAVEIMTAGHAVVSAIRDWLSSVSFPDGVKNGQWYRLNMMLNCYALAEKGARL